ncbi:MAG TPA: LysR family transcriptional regulator, partial [Paraburkholderia sp.]
ASFDIGLSARLVTAPARGRAAGGSGTGAASIVVRREKLLWASAADAAPRPAAPYQLVLLPQRCQLQRFVVRLLDEHHVSYVVSHSASGVAGLQLALKAGLGISCLNESSLGDGVVACGANIGLPALPAIEFHLLPGRPGESELVSNARAALTRLFA